MNQKVTDRFVIICMLDVQRIIQLHSTPKEPGMISNYVHTYIHNYKYELRSVNYM